MKNEEIMVSICCLVYNHEKYLRKCLDGFIMQKTDYKFEVLIHDDASTDKSADIIREYEKKYPDIFKPIYQKENQHSKGIKISLIYQLARAKGKYIAFCEGDDYWCDDKKLEKQIDFLESNAEYSGCVHNTQIIDVNENQIGFAYNETKDCDIVKLNCYLDFPHTTSYLFRNPGLDLSEQGKFLYSYLSGWDKSYALYMVKTGKVRYFADVMSCYRYVNSEGTSYQARMKKNNMTKMIVGAELEHYEQVKAYELNIDIKEHYYRNVLDYALKKWIVSPNIVNWKLFIYGIKKCPYKKYSYIFFRLKMLPRNFLNLPKKLLKKNV